ncbi:MAG: hypothetical protein UT05_C0009G0040 [Parcubacteria group bacterium GW2011_GWF2_38_76]|nr:MAG: hypothetical protein UT05_C0009G0040 [Parcubacteria group bacterium GW2011_GWF2_38_76]
MSWNVLLYPMVTGESVMVVCPATPALPPNTGIVHPLPLPVIPPPEPVLSAEQVHLLDASFLRI